MGAASQVIAERGVDRASLATIGRRAGVSRGLASHHFGSKDALLERVAERAQHISTEAVAAAVEQAQGGSKEVSGLDLLRTVVHTYLGRLEDPTPEARALIVMWGATFASEQGVQSMASADERAYQGLAERVREGQSEGSIRPDVDPEGTAVLLLGLMRGVGALLLTGSEGTDFSRVRETCDALITGALRAETPVADGSQDRKGELRG